MSSPLVPHLAAWLFKDRVTTISPMRRLAAAASFGSVAGVLVTTAPDLLRLQMGWLLLGGVAAVSVGLVVRSLVAQVFARAAAWLTFVPSLATSVVLGVYMLRESAGEAAMAAFPAAGVALGSGLALFLSRPMLHTEDARARFSPRVYRRWFLTGAMASAAASILSATTAFGIGGSALTAATAFGALAAALAGSAIGIVRMRAWGVLLGGATALALLVAACFQGDAGMSIVLALAAVPALFFAILPVMLARLTDSPRARVGADAYEPARIRIATEDAVDPELLEGEEIAPRAAASALP